MKYRIKKITTNNRQIEMYYPQKKEFFIWTYFYYYAYYPKSYHKTYFYNLTTCKLFLENPICELDKKEDLVEYIYELDKKEDLVEYINIP